MTNMNKYWNFHPLKNDIQLLMFCNKLVHEIKISYFIKQLFAFQNLLL
jgi:hypothetical protein